MNSYLPIKLKNLALCLSQRDDKSFRLSLYVFKRELIGDRFNIIQNVMLKGIIKKTIFHFAARLNKSRLCHPRSDKRSL